LWCWRVGWQDVCTVWRMLPDFVWQWNTVGSPDDGHKDARNMLRYYWFPINHYFLHLVCFSFTYLSKMHGHSNMNTNLNHSALSFSTHTYNNIAEFLVHKIISSFFIPFPSYSSISFVSYRIYFHTCIWFSGIYPHFLYLSHLYNLIVYYNLNCRLK